MREENQRITVLSKVVVEFRYRIIFKREGSKSNRKYGVRMLFYGKARQMNSQDPGKGKSHFRIGINCN